MSLFCSIDIETTGLSVEHCNVIEIGAVIDDTLHPRGHGARPEYHCYIAQDLYQGEPYALSMHVETFRRIGRKEEPYRYLSPLAAVHDFAGWLAGNWDKTQQRVLFAGKNVGSFDIPFLRKLPGFDDLIPYRNGFLDPGPLFFIPGTDEKIPALTECCKRAGIRSEVTHTALEDAQQVAALLQAYFGKTRHKGWVWPRRK